MEPPSSTICRLGSRWVYRTHTPQGWRAISKLPLHAPQAGTHCEGAAQRVLGFDGAAVEQGDHEALIARDGFYAELYRSQFASSSA